jgi:UDP-glucose 4-epimerase
MKRVVVTGASGFIGANLTRRLLGEGHEIHLFLRRAYQPWRLEEILDHVRCHEITVEDRETVSRAIREIRPDWVFNLAAFGAYSWQVGLEPMVATNVLGCASLVEACAKVGVEAFIQTGSSSEYGYKDHATREDELAQPNSHYAITKLAATHYCQLASRDHGLNIITVRLYSIYGPYEEPTRLIPTLAAYGIRGKLPPLVSPWIARDFVHVDDAISAMLLLTAARPIEFERLYNICSGTQSTIETLVAIARNTMNIPEKPSWSTMKPRSWDTNVWLGSPDLIARQVGWHPALNLEVGFRKTVDWLLENPKVLKFYSNRLFG